MEHLGTTHPSAVVARINLCFWKRSCDFPKAPAQGWGGSGLEAAMLLLFPRFFTPKRRGSSPPCRVSVPLWGRDRPRPPLGTRPAVCSPEGTLTALTLKSNFGQAESSSIVHKPDIYVSEILPLQDALLFMILSNKMPPRPQPTSFSFPDVFVGQSSPTESLKASACP